MRSENQEKSRSRRRVEDRISAAHSGINDIGFEGVTEDVPEAILSALAAESIEGLLSAGEV
jgi:hypothetical protein